MVSINRNEAYVELTTMHQSYQSGHRNVTIYNKSSDGILSLCVESEIIKTGNDSGWNSILPGKKKKFGVETPLVYISAKDGNGNILVSNFNTYHLCIILNSNSKLTNTKTENEKIICFCVSFVYGISTKPKRFYSCLRRLLRADSKSSSYPNAKTGFFLSSFRVYLRNQSVLFLSADGLLSQRFFFSIVIQKIQFLFSFCSVSIHKHKFAQFY